MSIIDLLQNKENSFEEKMYGLTLGIVTNTEDPSGLGRIKAQLLLRDTSDNETDWIRVASLFTGESMGAYFIPSVGEEVLIAFINGDIHKPFVLGSLWSKKKKPPVDNEKGKNHTKMFKTKTGIEFTLKDSDNDKESSIEMKTPKGLSLTLTDKDECIEIKDEKSKNSVKIDSKNGTMDILAEKKIYLKSGGAEIKLDGTSQKIDIKATTLSIKAAKIDINADSALTIKSNGILNAEASGPANLKGAIVKIN